MLPLPHFLHHHTFEYTTNLQHTGFGIRKYIIGLTALHLAYKNTNVNDYNRSRTRSFTSISPRCNQAPIMSFRLNYLLYSIFCLLITGCTPLYSKRHLPGTLPQASDQCRLLSQKRQQPIKSGTISKRRKTPPVPVSKKNPDSEIAVIQSEIFPVHQPDSVTLSWHVPGIHIPARSATKTPTVRSNTHQKQKVAGYRPKRHPKPVAVTVPANSTASNAVTQPAQNTTLPAWLGLSALISMTIMGMAQQKMKQLSRWASNNRWATRGLLTGIHIAGAFGALAVGEHLYKQGLMIDDMARYASLALIGLAAFTYPGKRKKNTGSGRSYLWQKMHDITLFTSGTLLMIYAGNHYAFSGQREIPSSQIVYRLENPTQPDHSLSLVRKTFPPYTGNQQTPKEDTDIEVVLLILSVLTYIGLVMLVGALACDLACSGSQALANIVLFGGVGLLTTLLIFVIYRILNGPKKRKRSKIEEVEQN